jgi:hypothetical protein
VIVDHLLPAFIEAMSDIGRYGFDKYAEQSFEARASRGLRERPSERTSAVAIGDHAAEHFAGYLRGELHDHFGTSKHQLAAVAFNAMMEFYFAGLDKE